MTLYVLFGGSHNNDQQTQSWSTHNATVVWPIFVLPGLIALVLHFNYEIKQDDR